MRCLALAEELKQGGTEVGFITCKHEGNLIDLIKRKGFKLYELSSVLKDHLEDSAKKGYANLFGITQEADAAKTVAVLKDLQPDWVIVDHYAIGESWERKIRASTKKIMVIDDLANRRHDCDLLLDQNYVRANHPRYADLVSPACTVLSGPKYALLRNAFTEARKTLRKRDGSIRRIFVFFGGVDPDNMTGKALEALSAIEFSHMHADVVIGAANPHRDTISHAVTQRPLTRIHVQVENIAEIMAQADLALCAGGTTTWERFCLGLPSLVVTIANNQIPFTRDLHRDGLLRWLGNSQDVDASILSKELMQAVKDTEWNRQEAELGMQLVDGKGAQCVASLLLAGPGAGELVARKAVEQDCTLLWHWVNDPEVRRSAFNTKTVSWEDHKAWFITKLQDPESTIFVIVFGTSPIGQVRFQRENDHYSIHYSLARQYRGFGLGKTMLALAIQTFRAMGRTGDMVAEVKSFNAPSSKIFERLGFQEIALPLAPGVRRFLLQFSPNHSVKLQSAVSR